MFWGGVLLGLIIGCFVGVTIISLMVAAKDKDEEDSKTYEVAENNLRKYYTRPFNDIKLEGFKDNLKIIILGDIDFYKRMHDINKSPYYLGRIEECKFILNLVEGKVKDEIM